MERLAIAILLVVFLIAFGGKEVDCGKRGKRQTYRVITNTTLPCAELETMLTTRSGGTPPRRIELNDNDKKELMRIRGYYISPSIMASADTSQLADVTLPFQQYSNLNTEPRSTSARGGRTVPKFRTRSDIVSYLKKTRRANNTSTAEPPLNGTSRPAQAIRDPSIPFVLPEELGINATMRPTSNSDDFNITIDFCLARSTRVHTYEGTDYLRMCTACSTTVTTTPNVWPSTLYGVVCSANEMNCLYDGTTPHGRCYQAFIPLTLLKKSTSSCVLVLESGENLVADDWESFTYNIGISCDCTVSENSTFR